VYLGVLPKISYQFCVNLTGGLGSIWWDLNPPAPLWPGHWLSQCRLLKKAKLKWTVKYLRLISITFNENDSIALTTIIIFTWFVQWTLSFPRAPCWFCALIDSCQTTVDWNDNCPEPSLTRSAWSVVPVLGKGVTLDLRALLWSVDGAACAVWPKNLSGTDDVCEWWLASTVYLTKKLDC